MLAVAGRDGASRDKLLACLWPDASSDSARHSLTDAVYRVRKELGAEVIHGPSTTLRLNSAIVRCDVVAFETALEAGDPAAAMREYGGPFLDGFHVRDSVEFEHWRDAEARRLERAAETALETLAGRAEAAGEFVPASAWLRRLLDLDPYNSRTTLRLMSALAESGDPANAIRLAEEHGAFLESELGVEPPAEVLNAAASLQRTARGGASLPFLVPVSTESTASSEAGVFAFVGRHSELRELHHWLDAARAGMGRVGFITGDAGTGKTALAHELCRTAMDCDPSLIVASGACNAQTGLGDPYHPFREVLGLLTGDVEAPGAAGSVSGDHATRLWSVSPETVAVLADHGPDLVGTFLSEDALRSRGSAHVASRARWIADVDRIVARRPPDGAPRQSDLFEQYVRVLRALAAERPLLLVLDDLQWADAGSIGLLFRLSRALEGRRILILGLYRPSEIALGRDGARHPLEPVLNELRATFGDVVIDLQQTGDRAFVDALLDSEPNRLGREFRAALFDQTRGHALFTVELLRSLRERNLIVRDADDAWIEESTVTWDRLPDRVDAVIEERIARLPQDLLHLLSVASVEGEEFTLEAVAHVLGVSVTDLFGPVSHQLEKVHRLVAPQALRHVGSQRLSVFRFRHILFQRYLYDRISDAERAYLHEQVGRALEALHGERGKDAALQLARHFREAELPEETYTYMKLAGDRARDGGAWPEAAACHGAALAALLTLPPGDERDRRELELQLGRTDELLSAGSPEQLSACERANELAERMGTTEQRFWATLWMYWVKGQFGNGDNRLGRLLADKALAMARESQDGELLVNALDAAGWNAWMRGEFTAAVRHWEDLIARIEAPGFHYQKSMGNSDLRAVSMGRIGLSLWFLGYPDEALARTAEAMPLAVERRHYFHVLLLRQYDSWTWMRRGDTREALVQWDAIDALARESGLMRFFGPWIDLYRGLCWAKLGNASEGIDAIRRGLDAWQAFGWRPWLILAMNLAEALSLDGRADEALASLSEAHAVTSRYEDFTHEADYHRLRGDLLLSISDPKPEEAEAEYRTAIDVARKQQARSYELRATTSLGRLLQSQGRGDEVRSMLEKILGWFTEGFDTPDQKEARQLLAELGRPA